MSVKPGKAGAARASYLTWASDIRSRIVLPLCLLFTLPIASVRAGSPQLGAFSSRPDRLITISGQRDEAMVANYSIDGGVTWNSATIYTGETVDEWRATPSVDWDSAAQNGHIASGNPNYVWNYFYDVSMPTTHAFVRLKGADTGKEWKYQVDLTGAQDVFMLDYRNFEQLSNGHIPSPWAIVPSEETPAAARLQAPASYDHVPSIEFDPDLTGWHRVYVGLEEKKRMLRFGLSGDEALYEIPRSSSTTKRHMQEFFLRSADLSGQSTVITPSYHDGGWTCSDLKHVRYVPMEKNEIAHHVQSLALA